MAFTITVSWSGGVNSVVGGVLDFTSTTFSAVDTSNTANSGASSVGTPFNVSITTTATGDVIVGMIAAGTGTQTLSASPTSNPTMTIENNTDANTYVDEMGIWTSSGTKNIGFTNSSQTFQLAQIAAAFKAAGTATFGGKTRIAGSSSPLVTTVTQPTSGDLVVVGITFNTTGSNVTSRSVIDSLGNTYTELVNVFNSSSGLSLSLFYCLNFTSITPPTVTTQSATSIASTSATANGTITVLGGAANCTQTGFVYDTSTHTTPGNVSPVSSGYASILSFGSGIFPLETFTGGMLGLLPNTTYFVRAFAKNSAGWGYGSEVSFTTAAQTPTPGSLKFGGFAW